MATKPDLPKCLHFHEMETKGLKTYGTPDAAHKALAKEFANFATTNPDRKLTYILCVNEEGRYFPVFIGMYAVENMVHFRRHVLAF